MRKEVRKASISIALRWLAYVCSLLKKMCNVDYSVGGSVSDGYFYCSNYVDCGSDYCCYY